MITGMEDIRKSISRTLMGKRSMATLVMGFGGADTSLRDLGARWPLRFDSVVFILAMLFFRFSSLVDEGSLLNG